MQIPKFFYGIVNFTSQNAWTQFFTTFLTLAGAILEIENVTNASFLTRKFLLVNVSGVDKESINFRQ